MLNSHHHPSQKFGVLNTFATRAIRIYFEEHLENELEHLTKVFKENGYKYAQIKKAFRRAQDSPGEGHHKE